MAQRDAMAGSAPCLEWVFPSTPGLAHGKMPSVIKSKRPLKNRPQLPGFDLMVLESIGPARLVGRIVPAGGYPVARRLASCHTRSIVADLHVGHALHDPGRKTVQSGSDELGGLCC